MKKKESLYPLPVWTLSADKKCIHTPTQNLKNKETDHWERKIRIAIQAQHIFPAFLREENQNWTQTRDTFPLPFAPDTKATPGEPVYWVRYHTNHRTQYQLTIDIIAFIYWSSQRSHTPGIFFICFVCLQRKYPTPLFVFNFWNDFRSEYWFALF